jgi:diphosphomevalonate decarboxylase
MQRSVGTSSLLAHRVAYVVPDRMAAMTKAIRARDFQQFAEITMQDSNSFHAVCLDTFPPIFYMNDVSRAIVQLIIAYNDAHGEYKAAYTFDAGPNAVIYTTSEHIDPIRRLLRKYFPPLQGTGLDAPDKVSTPAAFRHDVIPAFPKGSVKDILHTTIGDGPTVVEGVSLFDDQGLPKNPKV